MNAPIRVLIVDDSALIRSLLRELISDAGDMLVVGAAADPHVAREMIKRHHPDVVTLDVEMPRMNGLEFLEKLMRLRPTRVLMISTMTQAGSEVTLRALQLGAVDFMAKPQLGIEDGLRQAATLLQSKIRTTAAARVRALAPARSHRVLELFNAPMASTERLFVLGASTGGTEAIARILMQLPPDAPATIITQHMPPLFTASFAKRLDRDCRVTVKEAEDGERALPGHAYIAPGDRHLRVCRTGSNYVLRLSDELPVNRHRPSIDVLFSSAAQVAGESAAGVILTGMGSDGAAGLLAMRRAGSFTIAQDEASSVIFGMPKAAIECDAAAVIRPLDDIAATLMSAAASGPFVYRL